MESPAEHLDGPPYHIRAVQRVCDILDLLQDASTGVALPDVAEVTGLPKSSAFRYLVTLEARRYVERDPDTGNYRVGLAFLPLRARQFELLARRLRPALETLRDRFEETINLGLLDSDRVIYLSILESPRSVRLAARSGDRDPIHSTALGKAIAAHLPVERVRQILAAEGMPRLTERTITDVEDYLNELQQVRESGFSVDDGENELDGRCVAVPLLGSRLPAAVSLSAPAVRLPPAQVGEVARAIAEACGSVLDHFGSPPLVPRMGAEGSRA
jgi:IclR family transcriptional regulator, acetate operon repressor